MRKEYINDSENIVAPIKMLCQSVTESTYDTEIQQDFKLLPKLYGLGTNKKSVYQLLLQYHNNLENSLSRDFIADVLDFVTGWCSPQNYIWKN